MGVKKFGYLQQDFISSPFQQKISIISDISVNQEFFELMRRIDRFYDTKIRLGESKDKYFQKISISHPADLSFASREVVSLRQSIDEKNSISKIKIETRHFGLFAPYGPMPIYVTEHARHELLLNKNNSFEQFMGILSQRFAIFQYRSWAQLHVAVSYDNGISNLFQKHIDQTIDVNPDIDSDDDYNKHLTRVRRAFSGSYLPGRKSLSQLQKILSRYFNIHVKIVKRHPIWMENQNDDKFRLSHKLLGKRFLNVEYSALIELGPFEDMSYEKFDRGEEKLKVLIGICNDFVNYLITFEVVLYVKTDPAWQKSMGQLRMGKNSWLKPKKTIFKRTVYTPS